MQERDIDTTPAADNPLYDSDGEGHGPAGEQLAEQLAILRPRMRAVASRMAPNASAAEDIVQNAFEKAIRKSSQFRGQARFSTWLHRIVVNEALMWLRTERRRTHRQLEIENQHVGEWMDGSPDPAAQLLERERIELVRRGLRSLPRPEREVLLRCAIDGASYEQFSCEAGIEPAAAKSRAFRARRHLRSLLSPAL